MSRKLIVKIPGQTNINDQFITGNLANTQTLLKKLLKDGKGNYLFGALTAAYYGYVQGTPEYNDWMEELAEYDKSARKKIKKAVIAAVDQSPPLPIKFDWDPTGSPKEVIVTHDSSSYSIKIVGYSAPLRSRLADRKKKAASRYK